MGIDNVETRAVCQSAISLASGASADLLLRAGDKIQFGERYLTTLATPGHTEVGNAHKIVFLFL